MPYVDNDGVRIHYLDEGSGEPMLLIHGHTFDRRIWDDVMPGLLAAGQRVLRPDLRGHGLSDRPQQGYHHSHHAADMAAVLDDAGLTAATIVGYSVGGAVALEMALTMPERVGALVLVAPVLPDRPFEPEFFAVLKEVARTIRAEGVEAAMLGPWLDGALLATSRDAPGIRDKLIPILRDFPGAEYLATARDRVERDWTVPDRLAEITVPTVVLSGEHDLPGFRAWAAEIAAAIPVARLEVVAGRGHLLPLEDPLFAARAMAVDQA